MKKEIKEIRKKYDDYKYDHPKVRIAHQYIVLLILAALSAFIYAYGFKTFVAPSVAISGKSSDAIVTGGASGVAQVITLIFEICGVDIYRSIGQTTVGYLIQSIFYYVINIPLAILAFKGVGKRFALFTVVNISFYFIIINFIPNDMCAVFYKLSGSSELTIFPRSIFAGLCTGISSSIAMISGHSTGGVDIVSMYVTTKDPNKSLGKLSLTINSCIVVSYIFASFFARNDWSFVGMSIYSIVYFFVGSQVIDIFVKRNKKEQLNIVTTCKDLPNVLIANFPHSATILDARGAFSKEEKIMVYMVVSTFEVKNALKIIKEIDDKAFVTVTKVTALSGRFFIKPND